MDDPRELLWVASRLLSYPDAGTWRDLPELERGIVRLPASSRERLQRFLAHVRSVDRLELEEEYVRTFDLSERLSLHLTYLRHGDSRDRGTALAKLAAQYRAAGLEMQGRELPDYLPRVLEFLAIGPAPVIGGVADELAPTVATLAEGLAAAKSPYSDVVGPAAEALRRLVPSPVRRWWGR